LALAQKSGGVQTQERLRLNPRKAWYRNLDEVTTKGDDEVTRSPLTTVPAT
jgi:hypothetical protein